MQLSRARALVLLLSLSTIGCKLKLEAKPKGFKPGESDIVILHVVSEKGADVFCEWCNGKITKIPDSGEADIEIKIPGSAMDSKKMVLRARKGRSEAELPIDLAVGLPPNLVVGYGVSCEPRSCGGLVKMVPSPMLEMYAAPPGMQIEFGADKMTVGADGVVKLPLKGLAVPPLEKRLLADVCTGKSDDPTPLASAPVTITWPDGVKATTTASYKREVIQKELSSHLYDIKKGPIVFPWEKAGARATGKRSGVYVFGPVCYDAGQAGATVADLDVIAVSETKERVDECVYDLVGEKTGTRLKKTSKITMKDELATAYDRVTGKVLGTKLFTAPKACDSNIKVTAAESIPDKTVYAAEEPIGAWAATFAK